MSLQIQVKMDSVSNTEIQTDFKELQTNIYDEISTFKQEWPEYFTLHSWIKHHKEFLSDIR